METKKWKVLKDTTSVCFLLYEHKAVVLYSPTTFKCIIIMRVIIVIRVTIIIITIKKPSTKGWQSLLHPGVSVHTLNKIKQSSVM